MRQRLDPPGLGTIWPAFTDALGGLLTILIFLITIFVISEVLLSREMADQDTAIDQLGDITSHLDQLLGEADARADRLQNRIEQLDSELARRQALLEATSAELAENQNKTELLEASLAQTRTEAQGLEIELKTQLQTVSLLRSETLEADEKNSRLEDQIALLSARAEQLTQELERLNNALYGTRGELEQANQQIGELQTTIGERERTMAENEQLIATQNNRIEEMDRLIKERLLDRVEELEDYASDFYGRLRKVFADNPDIKVVGDRFVFQSEVLFPSGEAELSSAGKPDLDKFVQVYHQLAEKLPEDLPVIIEVQGHTDRVPIRTSRYRSNWELSTARALDVVDYLVSKGIPPHRLAATGMGEYQPIAEGDDPSAYRRNRRIELKITSR